MTTMVVTQYGVKYAAHIVTSQSGNTVHIVTSQSGNTVSGALSIVCEELAFGVDSTQLCQGFQFSSSDDAEAEPRGTFCGVI